MTDETPPEVKKAFGFERSNDFRLRYANNVFYETTVFDITTTFGEYVQRHGKDAIVEQHTAITTSWLEAKLAAIFLAMNVAAHEKKFGALAIPDAVLPPQFKSEEAKLAITRLLELIEDRPPLKAEEATSTGATEEKK